jgi:hypothetical protein
MQVRRHKPSSFWTSIPKMLTALAAVLTSIAALYVALRPPSPGSGAARPATAQLVTTQPAAAQPDSTHTENKPSHHRPEGQELSGTWSGAPIEQPNLPLVLRIKGPDSGMTATVESPCQHFVGPVDSISRVNQTLTFVITSLGGNAPLVYRGEIKKNRIEGKAQQGPLTLTLTLTRGELGCSIQ